MWNNGTNNFYYPWLLMPCIPNEKRMYPPKLVDLMNSMLNFGNENKISIPNLALNSHSKIFDFSYPLSSNVNKDDFETLILNHFLQRRLGYETYTAWKIALSVKMNEIMPTYNKLFDAMENWNIFKDGETFTKNSTDNRENMSTSNITNTSQATSETNSINKFSDMPQGHISDIVNDDYVTNFTQDNGTTSSSDSSIANGKNNSTDTNIYNETSSKDVSNKMEVFKTFIENKNNIMSMIFKDLDVLFLQIF